MDPIGAAASLITLIDLTVRSLKVIDSLIQSYRKAPAELLDLKYHLSGLRAQFGLLRDVQLALSIDSVFHSQEELNHVRRFLQDTNDFLAIIYTSLESQTSITGKASRIKWAFRDSSKVKAWEFRLRKISLGIGDVLLPLNLRYSSLLKADISDLKEHLGASRYLPVMSALTRPRFLWGRRLSDNNGTVAFIGTLEGSISAMEEEDHSVYNLSFRLRTLFCLKTFCIDIQLQRMGLLWLSISPATTSFAMKNVVPENSEIMAASKAGNLPAVWNLLTAKKASVNDIDINNMSPLSYAIQGGSIDVVKLLISRGADLKSSFGRYQTSPLDWAFANRQIGVARFMLDQGAEIHHISAKGWTPVFNLFGSASRNHNSCDEYLEMLSAAWFTEFNAQDQEGWSIMHRAAAFGNAGDVSTVMRFGASLELQTFKMCWTPIFCAVHFGNTATFHELMKHESKSTTITDGRRWTLLHVAVNAYRLDIMKFLIIEGADPHAASEATEFYVPQELKGISATPWEIAKLRGPNVLSAFLEALKAAGQDFEVIKDEIEDSDEIFWPAQDQAILPSPRL